MKGSAEKETKFTRKEKKKGWQTIVGGNTIIRRNEVEIKKKLRNVWVNGSVGKKKC